MRVSVILAHPDRGSLNHAIASAAAGHYHQRGGKAACAGTYVIAEHAEDASGEEPPQEGRHTARRNRGTT
jgi:hypothetical protein